MRYSIFLDDERFPAIVLDHPQVIVRTFEQFVETVETLGFPKSISFDNDLGQAKEGKHCAQWLLEHAQQADVSIHLPHIEYYVHSQNPIAAREIEALMEDYHKYIQIHDESFTTELARLNAEIEDSVGFNRHRNLFAREQTLRSTPSPSLESSPSSPITLKSLIHTVHSYVLRKK